MAIAHKPLLSVSHRPSSRLPGVDGLRAVAALWVVFFHIQAFSHGRFHIPGLNLLLSSGSTGVSLFLVLSGFCLYLPFAGGRQHRFRSREFFIRRCRRLMPAYYVSLVCVLLVYLGAGARLGFSPLTAGGAAQQLGAHALLIHTLFPTTFYALNGAYWSLGLEWQLYLTLPLLIWGIRRFGIPRTLGAAVLCNVVYGLGLALAIHKSVIPPGTALATVVLPNQLPGRWAEFVLGMVAAELYTTGRIKSWARRGWFTIPLLVPVAVVISRLPLSHMVYGAVFFSLLCLVLASDNVVSKAASSSPLVAIGTMSYSLYLVHQPLVQGLAYVTATDAHATPQQTFVILVVLLPFILFVAWLLFMTVERRTLSSGRSAPVKVQATETADDASAHKDAAHPPLLPAALPATDRP